MGRERLQQLESMLEKDPKDPFLHYAVAVELTAIGNFNEAELKFDNIVQQFPDYLPVYYQAGKLAEIMGKPDKAIRLFSNGIELAQRQHNKKTEGELREALWQISDED